MNAYNNQSEGYLETRHRLKYGDIQTGITFIKSTLSIVILSTPYYFSEGGFLGTSICLIFSVTVIIWANIRSLWIADAAEDKWRLEKQIGKAIELRNLSQNNNSVSKNEEIEIEEKSEFEEEKVITSLQDIPKVIGIPFEKFFFVLAFISSFLQSYITVVVNVSMLQILLTNNFGISKNFGIVFILVVYSFFFVLIIEPEKLKVITTPVLVIFIATIVIYFADSISLLINPTFNDDKWESTSSQGFTFSSFLAVLGGAAYGFQSIGTMFNGKIEN